MFDVPKAKISESGFTMVEIALCLAIIGIALVAIIGVLPIGINTQKSNREETLVDQDASVFIENIRNGTRGLNDLTNYVYAITNNWTYYQSLNSPVQSGTNTYTYDAAFISGASHPEMALTSGANIIGLLGTPKYTDVQGDPIPSLIYGGISNHVVACVHSLSGPAVEKPPQNNDIIRSGSFSYMIVCDNAPMAVDTNLFYGFPPWKDHNYNGGNTVSYMLNGRMTFWQASTNTPPSSEDIPGESPLWIGVPDPSLALVNNLRELRLTFLWPLMPSGVIGNGRHTFATSVAGQLQMERRPGNQVLYYFAPQNFTASP